MIAIDKRSALAALNAEIAACAGCELSTTRTRTVPGEGRFDAEIVFIGEAPGYYEDQQGRPFVGPAGQFLEQLLGSIGLRRPDVFIGNVIKCRPPQNQDPLPHQIRSCGAWLQRQIEIIEPKLIVTLGRYSMAKFFPGQSISRIHGQPRRVGELFVVPMYHPAAALHQGSLRRTIEDDFRTLPPVLKSALKDEKEEPAPETQQMKLF
ncbi:MAG TPA: uracil-DNA glycosylase [Dehalococcoidia bacterium]|nr:uracil-DNA glycosylase [Dehalococcoidia bacterium]